MDSPSYMKDLTMPGYLIFFPPLEGLLLLLLLFTKLPSMANPNQSVRTCILKVDLKCCTGCQKKVSKKLQSLSGVTAAEYNAEKGLMTVTGDVEPMALVNKLTKCGKKTELVSVNYKLDDLISDQEEDDTSSSSDTSSNHDPKHMERETQVKTAMKKEGILRKYLLLGCCRSKSKVVQPFMPNRIWQGSSRFGNGSPGRYGGPPYQMIQQSYPRLMQQQPQVPMTGYNNMPWSGQPYFMSRQPQGSQPKVTPVNTSLHYQ